MKAKASFIFIAILLVGLGLRLILLNVGINLDDAITLYVAEADSLPVLFERVRDYEFGPPLYFVLMKFWISLAGKSVSAIALPSVFAGVLLIPIVALLAKSLTGCPRKALLAAWFAAVSPLAIFYSHEARCYSLMAVFTTASLWLIENQGDNSLRKKLFLFVSIVLSIYTHYLSLLIIGLYVIFRVISLHSEDTLTKEKLYSLLGIPALAALTYIPWLPYMTAHLGHGTYWVDPTPLTKWPLVLVSNLAATLPLAWLHGFVLLSFVIPLSFLYLAYRLIKSKGKILSKNILEHKLFAPASSVLIAASTLGYFTPFILGYSRYLVPFAVLAWIVIADRSLASTKRWVTYLVAGLIVVSGVDSLVETNSLASTDKNGLRAITREIRDGKFPESAFLITPRLQLLFIYLLHGRRWCRTHAGSLSDLSPGK